MSNTGGSFLLPKMEQNLDCSSVRRSGQLSGKSSFISMNSRLRILETSFLGTGIIPSPMDMTAGGDSPRTGNEEGR